MKKMTVNEFKTHFSAVVKAGCKVAVTFGKEKQIVGYFLPEIFEPKIKRRLGILEGKASVIFHTDFSLNEESFLG